MRDGVVQHFGPPQEVYDRPANTYVARFIGSPAMNIISGRLIAKHDKPELEIATVLGLSTISGFPLSSATLQHKRGQNVLVGIRPEHFSLGKTEGEGLPVQIDVVEPTGPDTLVVFKLGGADVIARLDPFAVAANDLVRLAVKSEKVVLFDAETELRID